MKRIFAFMMAAATMAFVASCTEGGEESGKASLTAEPSALSFEATGAAAQTVKVTATGGVEWEYEVPQIVKEWLTVSRDGDVLTASVTDNLKGEQRNAIVTLRATNNGDIKERTISVSQEANPNPVEFSISVEPAYMSFVGTEAPAQDVTVKVTGGMTWEATTDVDWITITPAEGKFGVSVTDNPDGKQREGTITVTPSDPEVDPATVRVVQAGKKEFKLSSEEKIVFPYNATGVPSVQIDIVATNVAWEAKIVNVEGNGVDWVGLGISTAYVNIIPVTNTGAESRTAWLVITTDWDECPEVRIEIEQGGAPDHVSTFVEGKEFSTGDFSVVEAKTTPWQVTDVGYDEYTQLSAQQNNVDLSFKNETFAFDMNERGEAGDGFMVKMTLVTPRIEWNKENYFEIAADQPYEIREYIPQPFDDKGNNTLQDKFTIGIGYDMKNIYNKYPGAYVIEYENKVMVNKAPLVDGTLTVTHNDGNNYTFVLDAKDDLGNVFKIDWTGDIKWTLTGQMEE